MDYLLHLGIFICIYTILAQSLSLVVGYSGQISFAHAGFYGIGAYTTGILSVNFSIPFLATIVFAMLISGIVAALISFIANRTVGDYYIIITLGIQVVIYSLMNNWQNLTMGPLGITGIPGIEIFGANVTSKWSFLMVSIGFTGIIWLLLANLFHSPFGRLLRALSEDEIFATSLGKRVNNAKVVSFTLSAMFASIAGVLYARYISYIDPSSFVIEESIFILSIVILGGMHKLGRIFVAATILLLLPEALRFVGMPLDIAANLRQMLYGLALILIVFHYGDKSSALNILDREENKG